MSHPGVGARVVLGFLRLYQRVVSPMSAPTCRYYPSCSEYAVRAVRRHGAVRGSGLAAWRLMRCNPWSHGGVDDVPGEGPSPEVVVAMGRPHTHHVSPKPGESE